MRRTIPAWGRSRMLPLCASILLSACATTLPPATSSLAARTAHPAFELEGRLSANDEHRSVSGPFDWRHDPLHDQWTAYSPLGQILAELHATPSGAELTLADGQRLGAASVGELLPALIGIDLPFARLPGWVQAVPYDSAEVRRTDGQGRPLQVIDQGWRIDYNEYHAPTADALPRRIDISRGEARIRLIIDRWSPQP